MLQYGEPLWECGSMARGEHDAWIAKVLGLRVPRPGGAREQRPPFPKLLQRWQQAQTAAREAVGNIGKAVLALPEVQADPRLAHAQDAIGMLPALVPDFGPELASLLEQGGAQDTAGAASALALVATYRQRVAAATRLADLENFARKHVGDFPVQSMLDDALAELEAGLKTTA